MYCCGSNEHTLCLRKTKACANAFCSHRHCEDHTGYCASLETYTCLCCMVEGRVRAIFGRLFGRQPPIPVEFRGEGSFEEDNALPAVEPAAVEAPAPVPVLGESDADSEEESQESAEAEPEPVPGPFQLDCSRCIATVALCHCDKCGQRFCALHGP